MHIPNPRNVHVKRASYAPHVPFAALKAAYDPHATLQSELYRRALRPALAGLCE